MLEDGSTEYLVTNLTPEQMAAENFSDLYRLHWRVDIKYREFKNRLEIEVFNSIKPVSIRQEFFAAMYLFIQSGCKHKIGGEFKDHCVCRQQA